MNTQSNRFCLALVTLLISASASSAPPITYLPGRGFSGFVAYFDLVNPMDPGTPVVLGTADLTKGENTPYVQFVLSETFTKPHTETDRSVQTMAMVKDGRVYKVGLLVSGTPTPIQVSNETGAGCILFVEDNVNQNLTNNRVVYQVARADQMCTRSPDDSYRMVRLGMGAGDTPLPAKPPVDKVLDDLGRQTGWLAVDTGRVLKHYDLDFGAPTTLTTFAESATTVGSSPDGSVIFLRIDNELRVYRTATRTLSGPLHTFLTNNGIATTVAFGFQIGVDSSFVYFADSRFQADNYSASTFKILRIASDGTGAVQTLASEQGTYGLAMVSANRVVYDVWQAGSPIPYAIKSVPKAGGAPTILQSGLNPSLYHINLVAVSGSTVYTNFTPAGSTSPSTVRMRDDGTERVSEANSVWIGAQLPSTCTSLEACAMWPEYLFRASGSTITATQDTGTLQSYSTVTNSVIATLGTIPAGQTFNMAINLFGTRALLVGLAQAPFTQDLYYADIATPNSLAKVGTGTEPPPPPTPNYQGLWWNKPAGSESGWGINFAHQGDVIFATWFTYDLAGNAWWLTMTANKTGENTYSGTLAQTRGPAFSAQPFNPSAVTATAVGNGTLTFTDTSNGTFSYTVNGMTQSKSIMRQVFGTVPSCIFNGQSNPNLATNYQDLWWTAGGTESGWGVNFTHQSDTIFATWFTYAADGSPLWFSATLPKAGANTYGGPLVRTSGPPFNASPFNPGSVTATAVGTLTVTFAHGNSATFSYTVSLPGQSIVTQTKTIARQIFRAPGTVCQ